MLLLQRPVLLPLLPALASMQQKSSARARGVRAPRHAIPEAAGRTARAPRLLPAQQAMRGLALCRAWLLPCGGLNGATPTAGRCSTVGHVRAVYRGPLGILKWCSICGWGAQGDWACQGSVLPPHTQMLRQPVPRGTQLTEEACCRKIAKQRRLPKKQWHRCVCQKAVVQMWLQGENQYETAHKALGLEFALTKRPDGRTLQTMPLYAGEHATHLYSICIHGPEA